MNDNKHTESQPWSEIAGACGLKHTQTGGGCTAYCSADVEDLYLTDGEAEAPEEMALEAHLYYGEDLQRSIVVSRSITSLMAALELVTKELS